MRTCLALIVHFCLAAIAFAQAPATLPLAGQWRFALDPADAGAKEEWFAKDLADRIRLPGSLQEQGFGELPSAETQWTSGIGTKLLAQEKYAPYRQKGQFKTPFWLTPPRHYVGAVWYQRDIDIPQEWAGRRIVLYLERPHWETSVWIDGKAIGMQNGLGMAHEHDITAAAAPGKHRLSIRVDNRVKIPVGNDAHSVSDQTQSNWNGIVGRTELRAGGKVWIDDVQAYPNVAAKKVKLSLRIGNAAGSAGEGTLAISAPGAAAKSIPATWTADGGRLECEYDLGPNAQPWDEFSPALHQITLDLKGHDTRTLTVGLRELGVDGTQFTINGRRIFLRGTLECCIFPLTGYPPTDVDSWKRILRIARAHGLNHIRFHSWCPPEAAFVAADEMGFYYQVEASCWATFGDGSPLDKWVYEETDRMIRAYGNHPSFILMTPTNEPHGKNRDRFLGDWIKHYAAKDTRRKYTAGSGWPMIAENEYHVTPAPRIQATRSLNRPPRTDVDYRDFVSKQKAPVVSHEIGQWCVYPNIDEIAKYTGSPKGGNIEIFRDFLDKAGMLHQAKDFLMASGRFQALLYKEEIEAALRTPGMAGLQLLDLHDFPGQGTAPVGVLDAFWEEKGFIKPEEYRRFCGQTVPLARMTARTFTNDQSFEAQLDIAHFGPADLKDAKVNWRIRDAAGKTVAQGAMPPMNIATGGLTRAGTISHPLTGVAKAAELILDVSIDGTPFANDWDFWVYPAKLDAAAPAGITISRALDDAAIKAINDGGAVLLMPETNRLAGNTLGGFRPVFWNRITFPSQREHTLGILCDPAHPALAGFPTESHSNWQWWDLQERSRPVILDSLPRELRPIIQVIDDWDACRKLGLIFEARVGTGRILFCAIDLAASLDQRPAARQLRRGLLDYMAGPAFKPTVQLTIDQLRPLFKDLDLMGRLGAAIDNASNQHEGYPAANVIDGNPATIWHTTWGDGAPRHPHSLTIRLASPARIAGLAVLPRQDVHNGIPREYVVHVSDDGQTWREAAKGAFANTQEEKTIPFAAAQTAKFIRFTALSGHKEDRFAALAELRIVPAP